MNRTLYRAVAGMCTALALAACGSEPTQPAAAGILVAAGDGQTGTASYPLADSIVVTITDASGAPAQGVPVGFTASGQGVAAPAVDTTDVNGRATTSWTLDLGPGAQSLQITAPGYDSASVAATATAFDADQISSGTTPFACAVASGTAYCWQVDSTPRAVAGGPYSEIAVGGDAACAVDQGGAPYCWDLWQGSTPAVVAGAPALHSLTMSLKRGPGWTSCGLAADGSAWCWGDVPLSAGMTTSSSAIEAAPGFHFAELTAGDDVLCGIDSAGAGYCWGRNRTNSLGLGTAATEAYYGTPQPLDSPLKFSRIANSGFGGCATAADGNSYCWGDSNGEPAGDGSSVRLLPGVNGAQYSMAFETTTLLSNSRPWWWGLQPNGDLGSNPLQVLASAEPSDAALSFASFSGTYYPCGLTAERIAYCWTYSGSPGIDGHWTIHAVAAP